MIGENVMRKITKKVLSTVLVLSLFAGFGASVASFATEGNGGEYGPLIEEDYENLTDADVGNYEIIKSFDPNMVPKEFSYCGIYNYSIEEQLGYDSEDGSGFAIVGDILYSFSIVDDGDYRVDVIRPAYCDAFGKACKKDSSPIEVIKIPDEVNGHRVSYLEDFATWLRYDINEYFPDLECLILPRTLKEIPLEKRLAPRHSRPLKIYVPTGTNCKYGDAAGEVCLPGLHVLQPKGMGISKDIIAYSEFPQLPELPANSWWCTVM